MYKHCNLKYDLTCLLAHYFNNLFHKIYRAAAGHGHLPLPTCCVKVIIF